MLKVLLPDPSACGFVYMIANSRKCKDNIWSLQEVWLDCWTRIKCMQCSFHLYFTYSALFHHVDRLVTFVKLTPGYLISSQLFLYEGRLSWLVFLPFITDIWHPELHQVNILHIRALVKADTVILFDTYGSADSRLHSVFLYHLEVRWVRFLSHYSHSVS